jgi:hypothetical protein
MSELTAIQQPSRYNPYTADQGAGAASLNLGVIAWSLGANQGQGTDFNDPTT